MVTPVVTRWLERETEIQLRAEQLARLKSLVSQGDAIAEAVESLREERRFASRRLLAGNTPAVAASGLQQLMNRYAEESRVQLDRVDVAGDLSADGNDLLAIPARLAGRADIYGLVDLLFYLQQGEKLLEIDGFRVGTGRGAGVEANLVSWSIELHGYYAENPGGTP